MRIWYPPSVARSMAMLLRTRKNKVALALRVVCVLTVTFIYLINGLLQKNDGSDAHHYGGECEFFNNKFDVHLFISTCSITCASGYFKLYNVQNVYLLFYVVANKKLTIFIQNNYIHTLSIRFLYKLLIFM